MERVRSFANRAARVNAPVLILGETGTGKSLLGKVIHQQSGRSPAPFLAINCAGIPDSLFESEFFGHQKGAFTGAREARKGYLEQAHMGSLFLDEIGELTVGQQAKLLTALEEGEVRRLGGEGTVRVDVRLLSATSRDLLEGMRGGSFRRELYHRLAVLVCHIPPLRERPEDIPLLARRFLRKLEDRHHRPPGTLSPDVIRYLREKPWHGNIRELAHLLEAALILAEGGTLGKDALQTAEAMVGDVGAGGDHPSGGVAESPKPAARGHRYAFPGTEEEERDMILKALARARGNKSRAARELGMARNTLRQRIQRYRLL
ncbi:MAG: sigma-54 dependent transcriptional regulator [Gemmatimonadetes bacterium]|nr:sigma-54 dependent transcriptional regulator [Gemmatimonadota bacterium]